MSQSKTSFLITFILVFGFVHLACSSNYRRFGLVLVSPDFELNGKGKNIDSIAFWEAPDPTESLMFVTAKKIH